MNKKNAKQLRKELIDYILDTDLKDMKKKAEKAEKVVEASSQSYIASEGLEQSYATTKYPSLNLILSGDLKGGLPESGVTTFGAKSGNLKSTLFFANKEREKIASYHDTFGVGKRKITRPFFAVGDREEDKLKAEFAKFYFKEMRI